MCHLISKDSAEFDGYPRLWLLPAQQLMSAVFTLLLPGVENQKMLSNVNIYMTRSTVPDSQQKLLISQ